MGGRTHLAHGEVLAPVPNSRSREGELWEHAS